MTPEEIRKKENDDLIARMRKGESLSRCRPQDTWFQPRPLIKKDKEAISRLYKKEVDGEGNQQT